MRFKIAQMGEAVLRQRARRVTPKELASDAIQQLIDWMRETMRDAPGVGLAAPQIGIGLQIAVIEDRAEFIAKMRPGAAAERDRTPVPFHVIVNPSIAPPAGKGDRLPDEPVEFFEGCLSFAGYLGLVARAPRVLVECLDEKGKPRKITAQGWYARILQHEIDHLNGTLYVDRADPRSLMTVENHARYWDLKPVSAVREELMLGPAPRSAFAPRE